MQKPYIYCLGPAGTYSHEVAFEFLSERFLVGGDENTIVPECSFTGSNFGSLEALSKEETPGSFAVVPIENSTEGLVADTRRFWIGLLRAPSGVWAHRSTCRVVGEVHLPVVHCLAGLGTSGKIERVFSHPQALGQCSGAIESLGARAEPTQSTAEAARLVAEMKDPSVAAICSRFAAERFGLGLIRGSVEDQKGNETRFHVVARSVNLPLIPTGSDRMALLFELEDRANALASALNMFGAHGVNLSTIHSVGLAPRRYAFYVEAECHEEDRQGQRVLGCLRTLVVDGKLLVLGSYPRAPHPGEGGVQ